MITFPIQVQIVPQINNIPPYTYDWTVTAPSTVVAPTITPISGVVDPNVSSIINSTVTAINEDAITSSTFTLTVKDSSDIECFRSTIFNLTNPCNQLTIQPITNSGNLSFSTVATGGNTPYTYNWDFDSDLFEVVSQVNGQITLKLKDGVTDLPSFFTIAATAVDDYGCSETATTTALFPKPFIFDLNLNAACNADGSAVVSHICIHPVAQLGTTIDWDSLSIDLPSAEWSYTLHPDTCGTSGREVSINIDSTVNPGTYTLDYQISTTAGIPSDIGTITVTVPDCESSLSTITILNQDPYMLDCTALPGDLFVIDLEPLISSTGTVDWNSFQFVVNNTPTTTNPISTELSGGQAQFDNVNHTITYTVPTTSGTDSIKWVLCNTDGACTPTACSVVITECNEAPITVNDAVCVTCGGSVNIDVAANDTFNGLLQSTFLNTDPVLGTAVVLSDNTIQYTVPDDSTTFDFFQYYITNHNGLQSNISTVNVNIACAGGETILGICPGELFRTPFDDLSNTPAINGTWSLITAPGAAPVAPNPYDDTLDFTGFATGIYVYQYSVTNGTCTDTANLTYIVGAQTSVINDIAGNATFLGAINNTTVTETPLLTGENNESQCPGQAVTLSSTPIPVGGWPGSTTLIDGDLWYRVTTTPDAGGAVNGQVVIEIPTAGAIGNGIASSILVAMYKDPFATVPDLLSSGTGTFFDTGGDEFVRPFFEDGLTGTQEYYIRIASKTVDGPGEFAIKVRQL